MLTHALTPTGGVPARLQAITDQLRHTYNTAFTPALRAAIENSRRFETPDGTEPFDPVYAADAAGCRAVNRQLATVVHRHFPGAVLVESIDEPAVIDTLWHHPGTGASFAIEWDHTEPFGDPAGLSVREVGS
ncbi:MAG: hypothetical protein AAF547_06235 [Actinomycetota bacterium]